jgi:hypothetical protein
MNDLLSGSRYVALDDQHTVASALEIAAFINHDYWQADCG